MEHTHVLLILLGFSISPTFSHKLQSEADTILNQFINSERYNGNIRPYGPDDGATVVKINMMIASIDHVDDSDMMFSVQLLLRQKWVDPRLGLNHTHPVTISAGGATFAKVWTPDLVFQNEITSSMHSTLKPNAFVRVYPSGEVLQSTRLSATLSCPMNLQRFPFDSQSCSISWGSFGWTTSDLIVEWSDDNPIQLDAKFATQLTRFKLRGTEITNAGDTGVSSTGNYSFLVVTFHFDRLFTYYLINIYSPSFMIMSLSWLIFWLPSNALEARLALGITSLLTMATQIYGINQSVPNVPYPKALDAWTGCCLTMVAAAIVEVVIGNQILHHHKINPDRVITLKGRTAAGYKGEPEPEPGSLRIDKICRVAFPIVFCIFFAFYYIQYGLNN